MRGQGILFPEKPTETTSCIDPPPPPPPLHPPANVTQQQAGMNGTRTQDQVSIAQLASLVGALRSDSGGLQQVTNMLWSWLTTLAAKFQEIAPLIPLVPLITTQLRSGLPVLGGYSAMHVPQMGPPLMQHGMGPHIPSLVLPPSMLRTGCGVPHSAGWPDHS
eukprot:6481914-Amphidinium_carterae.2